MTTPPVVPAAPTGAEVVSGDSTRALIVIALGILVLYLVLRAKPDGAAPTGVAATVKE